MQRIELNDLNPAFTANKLEIKKVAAFAVQQIEIEINNPENLTLHIRKDTRNGESFTQTIELKRFSNQFIFRENKHTLDTQKIKEFHFDMADASLNEIKATSKKFHTFKMAIEYTTTPKE